MLANQTGGPSNCPSPTPEVILVNPSSRLLWQFPRPPLPGDGLHGRPLATDTPVHVHHLMVVPLPNWFLPPQQTWAGTSPSPRLTRLYENINTDRVFLPNPSVWFTQTLGKLPIHIDKNLTIQVNNNDSSSLARANIPLLFNIPF